MENIILTEAVNNQKASQSGKHVGDLQNCTLPPLHQIQWRGFSQSHLQFQSRSLEAGSPSCLLHLLRTENDAVILLQVSSAPVPLSKPLAPSSIPCKPTIYSDQGSKARDAGKQSSDIRCPSFSPSPTAQSHPRLCSRLHAAASSLSLVSDRKPIKSWWKTLISSIFWKLAGLPLLIHLYF